MHEKREDKNTYQVFGAWSRPKNMWVRRFESEKEVWVERESFLLREKWENEIWNHAYPIKRKRSSMDREFYRESIEHESRQKWTYRGSAENLSTAKGSSWWIEDLSRIYQSNKEQRNFSRWIKRAVENVSSRNPEISMDREAVKMLSRS